MILCTALLALLTYALMTAIASTSANKTSASGSMHSPAHVVAHHGAPMVAGSAAITSRNSSG